MIFIMKKAKAEWVNASKRVYKDTNKVFNYGLNQWTVFSRNYKQDNPLCVHCSLEGKYRFAEVTDHIIPINSGGSLWDLRNIQGLCKRHDNIKRSKESRGVVVPHYGLHGELLPATSLDLNSFDIYYNDWVDELYNDKHNIIIIGPPASGKTYFTHQLATKFNIKVHHTDDYINNIRDLVNICKARNDIGLNYLVEGNRAGDLLYLNKDYRPTIVIRIETPDTLIFKRYKERGLHKYDGAVGDYHIRTYQYLKEIETLGLLVYKVKYTPGGGEKIP